MSELTGSAFLSVRNLERSFRDGETQNAVLRGISLDIAKGEFVSIVGRSGSGKSTLLHILGALDTGYLGQVVVAGEPLHGLSDAARARLRNQVVGFVFQAFHLVPGLSVIDNVKLPSLFVEAPTDASALAEAALSRVGLKAFAHRSPQQLSGGERQRVAIARAIFHSPSVLLCDEPTGNLDTVTSAEVLQVFKQLHSQGMTVVVVTHDHRLAEAATRTVSLRNGVLE